ncbi:hypothetical protein QWM81_21165 [Streptomyces ficellus]|uniref:Uncharacterized protein n=1 Tax=Streptomyces ficellus TaxID=1977088 RepID=A0ABT7ZAP8_9ACTN|nr:hypothetical protein [Streptomyces ficellus]MDN3296513.1 hypothetical protein [Streptomyces ficellus]
MPAATAQTLTAHPAVGMALAVLIGLLVTWGALIVAYHSTYPIGFSVTTFAFGAYVFTRLGVAWARKCCSVRSSACPPTRHGRRR